MIDSSLFLYSYATMLSAVKWSKNAEWLNIYFIVVEHCIFTVQKHIALLAQGKRKIEWLY